MQKLLLRFFGLKAFIGGLLCWCYAGPLHSKGLALAALLLTFAGLTCATCD